MQRATFLVGLVLSSCAQGEDVAPGDPSGAGGFGEVGTGAGGAVPGSGGALPGSGGAVPGSGGALPGTGGALVGTGGAVVGAGGALPGTGGASSGGASPGTGGAEPGAGGVGAGGEPLITGGTGSGGSSPTGCNGQNLLPVPDDLAARGPWDVGVRTVRIGRLTVEVMYPAQAGSTTGLPEATYDVRDWLPPDRRTLVPSDHSPAVGPIGGHLYRGVPIDSTHGPFPVVVFIHGTASFRIASGTTNVHWASRGFVVVAADYPGLFLADKLIEACPAQVPGGPALAQSGPQNIPADVNLQLDALKNPTGDVAFLAGRVDTSRVGISGHSQGACVTAGLTTVPGVQVVVPLTGSLQVVPSPSLKSVMFLAGMSDTVIGYNSALIGNVVCSPVAGQGPATSNKAAYEASPGPPAVTKRLVGITGGGHLVPTDLCQKNVQGKNAIEEANAYGVCGINNAVFIGLPAIFDCGAAGFDWRAGVNAVNYATTAALEETLHCRDRSAQLANLRTTIPLVGEFIHAP